MSTTKIAKHNTERGIPFRGEMVRAILDGRKTMTRRVVKLPPHIKSDDLTLTRIQPGYEEGERPVFGLDDEPNAFSVRSPYGQPGDRLRVKENSWIWCEKRRDGFTKTGKPKYRYIPIGEHVVYCADGVKPTKRIDENPLHCWRLKVARFMPRWASRITLEITAVRVERLQAITLPSCAAEGAPPTHQWDNVWDSTDTFRALWDSINAATHPWSSNPWVWVVSFRRVTP